MHYDARQAVNKNEAKLVDNTIRLTPAQIRDRYGHEVAVTKPRNEFFGTWELAHGKDSFTIELTR